MVEAALIMPVVKMYLNRKLMEKLFLYWIQLGLKNGHPLIQQKLHDNMHLELLKLMINYLESGKKIPSS